MKTNDDQARLLAPLLHLAVDAGAAILEVYGSDDFQTERKADDSPLTLADRRSHDLIDAGLRALAPGIPVLSEEGHHDDYAERSAWDELWLVDPLDGTKEFVKRNGEFTVNIALVQHGEPVLGVVYAPVRGEAWVGVAPPRDRRVTAPAGGRAEESAVYESPPGEPAAGRAASASAGGASAPVEGRVSEASVGGRSAPAEAGGDRESIPGHAWKLQIDDVDAARRIESVEAAGRRIRVREREADRISIIASRTHLNDATRAFIERATEGVGEVEILNVGSSLKLCYVAEGRADLYPRYAPTSEWDTAAGHAVVRAAGGEIYQAGPDADREGTAADGNGGGGALGLGGGQNDGGGATRAGGGAQQAARALLGRDGARATGGAGIGAEDHQAGGDSAGERGAPGEPDAWRDHTSVPLRYNKENLLNPWFVVRAW